MSHHKNSDCFLQESNDVCSQWGTDPKKDQRLLLDLMRSRIRSRRVTKRCSRHAAHVRVPIYNAKNSTLKMCTRS